MPILKEIRTSIALNMALDKGIQLILLDNFLYLGNSGTSKDKRSSSIFSFK